MAVITYIVKVRLKLFSILQIQKENDLCSPQTCNKKLLKNRLFLIFKLFQAVIVKSSSALSLKLFFMLEIKKENDLCCFRPRNIVEI